MTFKALKVELTWDQVEPLIRQALREDIRKLRISEGHFFSWDEEEEKAEREEMIAAMRKVQEWYGK